MSSSTDPEKRGNLSKHTSSNPLQKFLIGQFLKNVRLIAGDLTKSKVCEIGCGEGFALKNFIDHGTISGAMTMGLDLDRQSIDYAKELVPQVAFQCGSVYHLPFDDKEFDCIFLLEVLEHLEKPEKALEEVRRVTKRLITSVPHEPFFRGANFLRGKNMKAWGNDPEHIQHWGIHSFKTLLKGYGQVTAFKTPFPWLLVNLEF